MNLNQRIAKIDGKCACENPGVHMHIPCLSCNKKRRPDYLATENLHELVRVIRSQWPNAHFVLEYDPFYKTWSAIIERSSGPGYEDLSHALAEAIIESQG